MNDGADRAVRHAGDGDGTATEDDPGTERVAGTVVLDADGGLALDDEGRVRIEPWRTLDPALWSRDGPADLESLLSDLESNRERDGS